MKTKLLIKTQKLKKKVFLVDDHPIVRRGLVHLINQEPDLMVCGDAADVHQAFEGLSRLRPDVVVVDISLNDRSGLELIKNIKYKNPKLPALVLSMHDEALYAERSLRAGARGYLMKQEAPEKVVMAIRRILGGEIYVSEHMSSKLLAKVASGVPANASPLDTLSDRELEVFELIGNGLGTRQIAEKLCLSIKTIESYKEHIKNKLNLENSTRLFQSALSWIQDSNVSLVK